MSIITGIIPSRYASTRLPGKPLLPIGGKTMIQRVYEQANKCRYLHEVVVATDDNRIYEHVLSFGGKVVMTHTEHLSGTDRCFEAACKLADQPDVIINIQGDEPFINPEQIDTLAALFEFHETQIASLYKRIESDIEIHNPNTVKVVTDSKGKALFFSRSAIPYHRNPAISATHYKHIGLYGYRFAILKEITQLQPSSLELTESLEQLRWLENGYPVTMTETQIETLSIDTPDDLKLVEKYLKNS